MLGVGFAVPVLNAFDDAPSRIVAAVPLEHGPVKWDFSGRGNATVSVEQAPAIFRTACSTG
ncbi:MAG: hypothetical protein R3C08_13520 [Hyphomonas sp.]